MRGISVVQGCDSIGLLMQQILTGIILDSRGTIFSNKVFLLKKLTFYWEKKTGKNKQI